MTSTGFIEPTSGCFARTGLPGRERKGTHTMTTAKSVDEPVPVTLVERITRFLAREAAARAKARLPVSKTRT